MRLTSIFFRNARQPQNENKVPFKALLPLKLRERVTSKDKKVSERGCLYEISLLLTCLEENEFEDKRCVQEFNKLNDCYSTYLKNRQHSKIEQTQLAPVPNSKYQTDKQITYLLQRYPTV